MADFSCVPVVDVHAGNIEKLWPVLTSAIKSSMFVALDIEMSGLGNRKKLFAKDMDERYKHMCDTAKTRSIVALGISCFQYMPLNNSTGSPESGNNFNFLAQTFNLLLLSTEEYTVDPVSLKFLVDHGFDFNMQYTCGLPYTSSSDSNGVRDAGNTPSVQKLFEELVLNKIPVVLHNGLLDLIFIYQGFHCSLPGNMSTFLTDLSLVFSGGIYDTKYLAEFHARVAASYLEYVFRKSQRANMEQHKNGRKSVTMSFLSYPTSSDLTLLPCGLTYDRDSDIAICENYANHGWCAEGSQCTMSHDVDLIIDKENTVIKKKSKKRKRKRNHGAKEIPTAPDPLETEEVDDQKTEIDNKDLPVDHTIHSTDLTMDNQMEASDNEMEAQSESETMQKTNEAPLIKEGRTGGHRAGFDAFMTGFAFAHYIANFSEVTSVPENAKLEDFKLSKYVNKLSLSGKDIPLQVMQSSFAKPSKAHKKRMEKLISVVK